MSKKYYSIKIKRKEFHYHSINFFVCKAKNKNKAIEKFYKNFNKDECEIEKIIPLSSIQYKDTLFYLK